jgi:pimeloyl-ACP methyl ester carboxylesterase
MEQYRRDDLTFDIRDAGPPDGPVVVLLHGFPQHNDSWNAVIDRLTAQGYRCLARNQRGFHRAPGHPAAATTACPNSSPMSAH